MTSESVQQPLIKSYEQILNLRIRKFQSYVPLGKRLAIDGKSKIIDGKGVLSTSVFIGMGTLQTALHHLCTQTMSICTQIYTVMTVNFRQKKGLNRLVESELVSQCLTLVELVCVTISTQFVSFCYNIPNFYFFFFMYWLCKILDTKLSGYIKNHKLDKFDRKYTPYISPSNRSLIYMMLF